MTGTTTPRRVLVTGAGGFIGHHLVAQLKREGAWVRGVDLKHPEYAPTAADEFEIRDLREWGHCLEATRDVDDVYALAADMGGMGFISSHHAEILHNNLLISTHTLEAARQNGVSRYLYTSSACVYPEYRQTDANVAAAQGRGGLPRAAAGRLRLGEADHRASVPALRAKTTEWRRASSGFTTSSDRSAPGTAGARRRRRRCAARWRSPSSPATTRSRSGATANRRARSATSTTASTGSGA